MHYLMNYKKRHFFLCNFFVLEKFYFIFHNLKAWFKLIHVLVDDESELKTFFPYFFILFCLVVQKKYLSCEIKIKKYSEQRGKFYIIVRLS